METTPTPTPRKRTASRKLVAGAAIVGALLGTAGIAVAQTNDTTATAPTAQSVPAPDAGRTAPDPTKAVHPGEELLTGETATKVADAARQAVPDATVDRVETDAEGSPYEAHMTKADGSHVTVKVADDFSVSGIEDGPTGGPGGHHGPPTGGRAPAGAPADASGTPTA